ncbi:primosomal protein N' [Nemorincola caseinilytica]|uniref:Replication restart protein PriA n=2 Tax=Nemorincola caseinilytica TaxID=2054315 RepID=A0ABP8NEC9_9BACT
MFADVILPLNLPQVLTYGVPVDLHHRLRVGMRVEVALGKNKQYAAIVERLHHEKPQAYQVRPIRAIIDEQPVVTEKQLQFWRWVANYYMAAPGEVMQAALPAHMKLAGETRLQWAGDDSIIYDWSDAAHKAAEALRSRQELTISELREIVGTYGFAAALSELLEKEAVAINEALESDYKPRREKVVRLADIYSEEKELVKLFDQLSRAPKQLQLLMAYTELNRKQHGIVKQQELLERAQASAAQLKALTDKGIFIVQEQNVDRLPDNAGVTAQEITFTSAQQAAYDALNKGLEEKNVCLLHGVTGSGKTLLYVSKILECLAAGRQAILLLPEIALTTQLVRRLLSYFGSELGVYHSHFSNNERVEIWEKVRRGTYKVVAGPRSTLWLPYSDVGLIIVDEEHDPSYKQRDPAPRFHARDAAIYMAAMHNARVILGSATPSVESLYNVQQAKYAYVPLKERYQGAALPQIQVIDARSLAVVKGIGIKLLTPELIDAIKSALQQRRQVILFQNRRGYVPFMMCTSCGWTPKCRNCDVSLTYHKSTDKLHCHYCGFKAPVMHACPYCGSEGIAGKTYGTQKIEEEIQQTFPDARVARMDVDSMRGKNSISELFGKLEKRKVDILVGTQMVVKGLDLEAVSLVGVISADSLLTFPDFRVNERAFQLMEQVSGRAGRADGNGTMLIQAYNTQHPVLKWVRDHDVAAFYRNEIKNREHFFYPPYSRIIRILFRHAQEEKAAAAAQMMADGLATVPGIVVQGPGPAIIPRVRNLYIREIWIKCPRDNKLIDSLRTFLKAQRQHITATKGYTSVQVAFDVDPM